MFARSKRKTLREFAVNPSIHRVKSVRLSDQAVNQLRALIISGEFNPGDKLPSESELCEKLEVSRSSVREALRTLESRGLILVRTGSGAFVSDRPFSFIAMTEAMEWLLKRQEYLAQILQVREVNEGLAAALVAPNVTDDLLRRLHQIVQEQHELAGAAPNLERESELDIEFHELIAAASGNTLVHELVSSIVREFCSSNRALLYVSGKMAISIKEHEAVIQAIAGRDPVRAEKTMRAHVARVRNDILQVKSKNS